MGVNEIHDGRDSLLTQRLENIRRVNPREGHSESGGGGQFQQLFEFSEKEDREKDESRAARPDKPAPPPPPVPPRAITPEEVEKAKKRDEVHPGLFIDVQA